MNSDRRNELTKLLEQIAGIKSSDTTFALMGQVDARDILDLLNETTNEGTAMKESEAKERLRDLVKPGARWRPTDLVQAARDLLNAEEKTDPKYTADFNAFIGARGGKIRLWRDDELLDSIIIDDRDMPAQCDTSNFGYELILTDGKVTGRYWAEGRTHEVTPRDDPLPDVPGGQRVPYEAEDDPNGVWCVGCGETTPGNGRCCNCDGDTPTPRLVEITGPIYRLEVGGD